VGYAKTIFDQSPPSETIRESHQQHGSEEEEEEMMPTGETGAVTDQNMGPFGKVK
jgi:hypothetical protein